MAAGKVIVSTSRLKAVRASFHKKVAAVMEDSAKLAVAEVGSRLESGRLMINEKERTSGEMEAVSSRSRNSLHSDTGALRSSFYIVSVRGGNRYYNSALQRARAKFMQAQGVEDSDFGRVTLPQVKGGRAGSTYISGAASCLKYAAWWNNGHQNEITGKFERVPFITAAKYNVSAEFMSDMKYLAARFSGYSKRGARNMAVK